jgi:two-component system chemotaxis response regulator CheY
VEVGTVRALVVDDSQAMRVIIRKILVAAGYDVVEAKDGREALERLEDAGIVDVALVDWNMPEMNGLDLVRTLRGDKRFARMTLMMVTTEIHGAEVVRALAAGANEYLMKPFTREALLEKLQILGLGTSPCDASGS